MIHFSRKEDYAVVLVNKLVREYQKRVVPLSEIAKEYSISLLFLRNLANELKNAGIIAAKEGKKGGYFLNNDPHFIRIGEVLQIFSKKPLLECCPTGEKHKGTCDKASFCSAGFIWRKINKEFLDKIYNLSLIDFIQYKH